MVAPPCVQTLFSLKPRSVQAQQRVDRDSSEADQEFLHSVDPPSSSEWLPDDGQGFTMGKCAAVDKVNLPFARLAPHPTVNLRSLIREQRFGPRTLFVPHKTTRRKKRCSAAVQVLVTGKEKKIRGHNSRIASSFATSWPAQTSGLARQAICHLLDACSAANHTTRTFCNGRVGGQLSTNTSCPLSNAPRIL